MKLLDWLSRRQRDILGTEETIRKVNEDMKTAEDVAQRSIYQSQKTLELLYETGHPIGDLIERRVPHAHY